MKGLITQVKKVEDGNIRDFLILIFHLHTSTAEFSHGYADHLRVSEGRGGGATVIYTFDRRIGMTHGSDSSFQSIGEHIESDEEGIRL